MLGNLQKITMKRSKLKAKYYKMNTPENIKPFLSDKGKKRNYHCSCKEWKKKVILYDQQLRCSKDTDVEK